MITLRKKIKIIKQDLNINKNKSPIYKLFITLVILLIFSIISYLAYNKTLPIFKTINLKDIIGKKISITECNTKDYIIISKDKSYSMNLTDSNCEQKYYEGTIKIYKNQIIFNKQIKAIVNKKEFTINNKRFESE